MNLNNIEATETPSPEAARRVRRRLRLGAGWRFARHLLEMIVEMIGGVGALMVYRLRRHSHRGHGRRARTHGR